MSQFATVEDLGDRIGETIPPGQETSTADLLLQQASALIQNYTDQLFDEDTETVTLDAEDADVLFLPQLPVTAVSAVSLSGSAFSLPADIVFYGDGRLYRAAGVRWYAAARQAVSVTYTHGYPVTNGITAVPDDVRQVCLDVVARAVAGPPIMERATGTADSEGNPIVLPRPESVSLSLSEENREVLDRYRTLVVA